MSSCPAVVVPVRVSMLDLIVMAMAVAAIGWVLWYFLWSGDRTAGDGGAP